MSRWITTVILAVVGIAWVVVSFQYGLDPNTSPTLRYAVLTAMLAAMVAIQIQTVVKSVKRAKPSANLKVFWGFAFGMEAIVLGMLALATLGVRPN